MANNPINLIDPTGMWIDDYSIDKLWYIKKEKGTKVLFDRLFTKKDYGSGIMDNGIKLKKKRASDKTILADLEQDRSDFKGNNAMNANKEHSFKVFLFVADNTDIEWSISGFGKGSVDRYAVTTSHERSLVTLGHAIDGNTELDMIFNIHSHPSPTGTKGASYDEKYYKNDMTEIRKCYYRFQEKGINPIYAPKEYVYHKQGKVLYNYTPWNPSIYIRPIKAANDLYRGLGF